MLTVIPGRFRKTIAALRLQVDLVARLRLDRRQVSKRRLDRGKGKWFGQLPQLARWNPKPAYAVVIIGGGDHGLVAAYYLARKDKLPTSRPWSLHMLAGCAMACLDWLAASAAGFGYRIEASPSAMQIFGER